MHTIIQKHKEQIIHHMDVFFAEKSTALVQYGFDQELITFLHDYAKSGKVFRGALFLEMYSHLSDSEDLTPVLDIALMLELLCSAMLIHDDIMDRDEKRRGLLSMHKSCEHLGMQHGLTQTKQFGIAAGLCQGDIAIFMANAILADSTLPADLVVKILRLNHHELLHLSFAQIEDVRMAFDPATPDHAHILEMYKGKTGRYTGRWPIALAATTAQVSPEVQTKLEEIGEELGLFYQLKDDYLGLFGDTAETGKSNESDILQGKKTLYWLYLNQAVSEEERTQISHIFGNSKASEQDIQLVKDLLHKYDCIGKVDRLIQHKKDSLVASIDQLDDSVDQEVKTVLVKFLQFIIDRKK